jgi:pyridoxal phosphate enzyme (YggS family)
MNARAVVETNLRRVEERIDAACARAGRGRGEITLVAVTKSVGPEVAAVLPEMRVFDVGESRPQAIWAKAAVLGQRVHMHLVGHLQRNKVERTLPLVHLIHSVDSLRLLDAIEADCERTASFAAERERTASFADVLLEVNVSREPQKHGFLPEELSAVAERLPALRRVHIRGLMTMAAQVDDPEAVRPTFAELRTLRDRLRGQWHGHEIEHLSMGMTNDFEVAIEEGATLVRIGTALFEGLEQ